MAFSVANSIKSLYGKNKKAFALDLDGTLVKHNSYKLEGHDKFLPGQRCFLPISGLENKVAFIVYWTEKYKAITEAFLCGFGNRYDAIVYCAPYGE